MALRVTTIILDWVWRLVWINLIWILFSIPLITIIPSTFAMFTVINKLIKKDEEIDIFPAFVKAFKSNFFKSFPLGTFLVLVGSFLYVDLLILKEQTHGIMLIVRYAILIVTILFIPIACYSIPLFIECGDPWYRILPLSFMLAIKKPGNILLVLCGVLGVCVIFLFLTGIGVLLFGSLVAVFTTKGAHSSLANSR